MLGDNAVFVRLKPKQLYAMLFKRNDLVYMELTAAPKCNVLPGFPVTTSIIQEYIICQYRQDTCIPTSSTYRLAL
eukprot:scaffold352078_cov19-Prasinocladus_malaysianus.AAC.1